MIKCWRSVIDTITTLQKKFKVKNYNYINALITDGKVISGIRYSSNPKINLSLHYATGQRFMHDHTGSHMLPVDENGAVQSVIIASERLTSIKEEWHDVPNQHIITVDKNKRVSCVAI